jgi:hypothetical protein
VFTREVHEVDRACPGTLVDVRFRQPAPRGAPPSDARGCSPPQGCDIIGSISIDTREKIYHVPGGEYYDRTIIRLEYGERWFCTEQEAIANGWRRSKV